MKQFRLSGVIALLTIMCLGAHDQVCADTGMVDAVRASNASLHWDRGDPRIQLSEHLAIGSRFRDDLSPSARMSELVPGIVIAPHASGDARVLAIADGVPVFYAQPDSVRRRLIALELSETSHGVRGDHIIHVGNVRSPASEGLVVGFSADRQPCSIGVVVRVDGRLAAVMYGAATWSRVLASSRRLRPDDTAAGDRSLLASAVLHARTAVRSAQVLGQAIKSVRVTHAWVVDALFDAVGLVQKKMSPADASTALRNLAATLPAMHFMRALLEAYADVSAGETQAGLLALRAKFQDEDAAWWGRALFVAAVSRQHDGGENIRPILPMPETPCPRSIGGYMGSSLAALRETAAAAVLIKQHLDAGLGSARQFRTYAYCLYQEGRDEEAVVNFERALTSPEAPAKWHVELAAALARVAKATEDATIWGQVTDACTAAIKLGVTSAAPYLLRAVAALASDEVVAALVDLQDVVQREPEHVAAWNMLGFTALHLFDDVEVARALVALDRLDPAKAKVLRAAQVAKKAANK